MKTPWMNMIAGSMMLCTMALSGCFDASAPKGSSADSRLRVIMMQPPRSGLTPLSDDAFKLSRWSTAETLVTLDNEGNAVPQLATQWQREGDTGWRFELRPDVHFHDGSLLTADMVVNALSVAAQAKPKPRILDGVTLTIQAAGEHAVIVSTPQFDPLLPQRLSSPQLAILSRAAYDGQGHVSPIGTGSGPFVLTQVDGTSKAHLNRFDAYWGEHAKSAGIDVSFVPDGAARAASLRTGQADIVEALPVSQAALVDPEQVHEVPMPRTNTLYLNTRSGPFTLPALRAYVADIIDRQTIVDNVYEGRADVAQGLLGPALPWAARLRTPLATTGPIYDGPKPTITLATFSDRAELPEVAVYLANQLRAAGFTVNQVVREYAHIEADALAGKFDAFILSRATVLDSGDPLAYFYSDFACQGSFNIAQLCDSHIDQALHTAATLPAGEARRAALIEVEHRILASHAAIPLLHERVIQGETLDVQGAVRDPRERRLIGVDTQRSAQEPRH